MGLKPFKSSYALAMVAADVHSKAPCSGTVVARSSWPAAAVGTVGNRSWPVS